VTRAPSAVASTAAAIPATWADSFWPAKPSPFTRTTWPGRATSGARAVAFRRRTTGRNRSLMERFTFSASIQRSAEVMSM
jgi:hypothetical protein